MESLINPGEVPIGSSYKETADRVRELETKLYVDPVTKTDFDPKTNDKAISLIQQEDGNWMGCMNKYGKIVTVRQYDPQICLQLLLTHDGKGTE